MRTGDWPWSRVSVTPINSLGFPDAEFPDSTAPKTCTHVVVIGDSFVFGDGVDGDSSWVGILARDVAARTTGRCIRVFNLGERGTSVPRQARRLRELRARLRPDVVILGQYQNDLTDLLDPEPTPLILAPADTAQGGAGRAEGRTIGRESSPTGWGRVQDRLKLFSPRIVRFLSYHVFAAMITNGIHRDELARWSVLADTTRRETAERLQREYSASFDSLATELAADRIAFGVVIFPSKFDVLAGRYPEEALFLGLAERHRLPALRIFPVLDAKRAPYAFLMYDGHLNEHGNRLVADAVSEWLFTAEPAPFGALRAAGPP
jgi:lysophospholipase L1-like esterase